MKKFAIFCALIVGGGIWLSQNLSSGKVLDYAKQKNDPEMTPKIEYWVGLYHLTRDEFPQAAGAFEQVLLDHPTSQYAPPSYIKLANAYQRMARKGDSITQYELYLEKWPEGEFAGLAKKNVEFLKNQ